jgi:hypothetical protein
VYDAGFNPYDFLRELPSIGWVGRSMLVYDLDRDHDLAERAIARQKARQAEKTQRQVTQQQEEKDHAGAPHQSPDHPPGDDR